MYRLAVKDLDMRLPFTVNDWSFFWKVIENEQGNKGGGEGDIVLTLRQFQKKSNYSNSHFNILQWNRPP